MEKGCEKVVVEVAKRGRFVFSTKKKKKDIDKRGDYKIGVSLSFFIVFLDENAMFFWMALNVVGKLKPLLLCWNVCGI